MQKKKKSETTRKFRRVTFLQRAYIRIENKRNDDFAYDKPCVIDADRVTKGTSVTEGSTKIFFRISCTQNLKLRPEMLQNGVLILHDNAHRTFMHRSSNFSKNTAGNGSATQLIVLI